MHDSTRNAGCADNKQVCYIVQYCRLRRQNSAKAKMNGKQLTAVQSMVSGGCQFVWGPLLVGYHRRGRVSSFLHPSCARSGKVGRKPQEEKHEMRRARKGIGKEDGGRRVGEKKVVHVRIVLTVGQHKDK